MCMYHKCHKVSYLFRQVAHIADVYSDDLNYYHACVYSSYQYFVQCVQRIKLQTKMQPLLVMLLSEKSTCWKFALRQT